MDRRRVRGRADAARPPARIVWRRNCSEPAKTSNLLQEVIQRVGDEALHIYLYHVSLIERLRKEYPGTVAGIKTRGQ